MAYITLNRTKLRENFLYLDDLFKKNNIEWAVVTKLLCGNATYLKELFSLDVKQVCDSRVTNLKTIKKINPEVETIYIKPPAKRSIKSIVQFADISFNTELETIRMLSAEAGLQGKTHKVIIMIELGELREGVMRDDLLGFYESVFKLPNIEVVGLGANLSCLYGVLPNEDKLIQLSLYKQLIEARFNVKIPYVSGGSSVTIPLVLQNQLPDGINHFRVGDTLFLASDVYNNSTFPFMHNDVISLFTEIIEVTEKPKAPSGELGHNVEGETFDFSHIEPDATTCRALIDIGILDVEVAHIVPSDSNIEIAGASSDMVVIDLNDNPRAYKVGDLVEFKLDYMGALRLLNSRYIEKKVVD
ncbi:alanine racemase [Natronoflexus pectinivorans]|uniref:Putative amino acid racemase n=1 Tax=Natronoflexus pectinivorans TaxID=682526 RepID=A0A4V2RWI8_9BACT|nr:alanine racemase [Natronoflexus pectinivorans]TCO08698.1 putative amino acid racemase [Natronoflexus pectinivorans]